MRFVRGQLAWMLAIVLGLSLLGVFSYEVFFVLSLIGFLIIVELTAPVNITPEWRRRLTWVVLIGLIVFAAVVVRRLLAILPPEVLP